MYENLGTVTVSMNVYIIFTYLFQVDKVRYLLDQVQQNLEEDRMATEKIQRQGTELSSALLEEETGRTELDGLIKVGRSKCHHKLLFVLDARL